MLEQRINMTMSLNGLAENIFFLERIDKSPGKSQDNPIPTHLHQHQPGRVLTLEQEQSIASALSFLSSYTDDPNRVSALCIEEIHGSSGLLITIASNSGSIDQLKAGLIAITTVLMNEATDGLWPGILLPENVNLI